MKSLFTLLAWFANWIKRHNLEAQPPCALVSCPRYSQSLWERLRHRHRPEGTFLQGAFYCQSQCLETALINQLSRLRVMAPAPLPPTAFPWGFSWSPAASLPTLKSAPPSKPSVAPATEE